MSNAIVPVELSEPLMHDAAAVAQENGISVATWISRTVEDRLRDERLTKEFYRRRALGGGAQELLAILDKAPDMPPIPGDEL